VPWLLSMGNLPPPQQVNRWAVGPPTVVERQPHWDIVQQVWGFVDFTGEVAYSTNRFVSLAAGLNRWDDLTSSWVPARAEFVRAKSGHFLCSETQYKVIVGADLSEVPAVDFLTPDGVRLRSRIVGVALIGGGSGESVMLGEAKSCAAEWAAAGEIVFGDAFDGLRADVRYKVELDRFEQEVVLREQVPEELVRGFGMDPANARLAVITEFFDPPEPQIDRLDLNGGVDLTFGSMKMALGRAFALDGEGCGVAGETPFDSVCVEKSWEKLDGRQCLVEWVELKAIAPWLEKLPLPGETRLEKMKSGTRRVALNAGSSGEATRSQRQETREPSRESSRRALASSEFVMGPEAEPWRAGSVVAQKAEPGVAIDYTLLVTATNFTFKADTTYYVHNSVTLSGTNTTIEGGTVVKFTNGATASILIYFSPVSCSSGPYRPAIFTAKDDDTVGETIPGSSGNPLTNYYYANMGLAVFGSGNRLHDLRIAHARYGLLFYDYNSGSSNELRHAQLVRCQSAVYPKGYLGLRNILVTGASNVIYGNSFTCRVEHLTASQCGLLAYDYDGSGNGMTSLVSIANSILAVVGAPTNVAVSQTSCEWPTNMSVFEAIGAGSHYLPAQSSYRRAGNWSEVLDLLEEIATRTTEGPLVLQGSIQTSTRLHPRARRDCVGGVVDAYGPDLGYHYDPIDVALGNVTVLSNQALWLDSGVAVATFGNVGVILEDNASLAAAGTADKPVAIFRYNSVQEQSTNWGATAYEPSLIAGAPHAPTTNTPPSADFRFSRFYGLGGYGYHIYTENSWWLMRQLRLRDCELWGGKAQFSGTTATTIGLTNNLFVRTANKYYAWPILSAYNNLFWGGSNRFERYPSGATWTFRDNAFHETVLTNTGYAFTHNHNAYLGTNQAWLTPTNASDIYLSSFAYAVGPLGQFYHAATNLVNKGSRNADTAGLYHYTVRADQTKETNSPVDIGFHYVASSAIGSPADYDDDGLPDYIEDQDGDGVYDVSIETNWTNSQTDTDGLKDGVELVLGTSPLLADSDADGRSDADERWVGGNPLDGSSANAVRLSYWRFNSTSLACLTNEAGVGPLQATNLVMTNSFEGLAPDFRLDGALLRLPCYVGTNQSRSNLIDLRLGSVRFWYMPNWYHGSASDSPEVPCTLLQVGAWKLSISADGRWLVFESPNRAGGTNENLRVLLPRSDGIGFDGRTGWQIVLSYTPGVSWIEVNGQERDDQYGNANAVGIEAMPSEADVDAGLYVGCSPGGTNPAQGLIDELETFNWPIGGRPIGGGVCETPFRRLWDSKERLSQVLTARAPDGLNQIELRWVPGCLDDPEYYPTNYCLYRRVLGQSEWSRLTNAIPLRADNYTDSGVTPGMIYEYMLYRRGFGSATTVASLRASPQHCRGKALLLVDGTVAPDIATELAQYETDLRLDGWQVVTHTDLPRHDDNWTSPTQYKADLTNVIQRIRAEYNANPTQTLVALLVGHVTIPYSGNAAEDGHIRPGDCHVGAWPADIWYGDMDGVWTDNANYANCNSNSLPLRNVEGDGKWDQDTFPANSNGVKKLEVAVGRIDFANMPAFINAAYLTGATNTAATERALIKNYFNKARWWRSKQTTVTDAWRLFVQCEKFLDIVTNARGIARHLTGTIPEENRPFDDVFVTAAEYQGKRFLWGLHGAHGRPEEISFNDTSVTRWRTSYELATNENEPQVVFYMLKGSYFPDWRFTNDFMRACLSTATNGLAAFWSAGGLQEPLSGPWVMDRLCLGYHLGAILQDTMSAYCAQSCRTTFVLGDATLHAYVTAPPTSLSATTNYLGGWRVSLSWSDSSEEDYYYIYRGNSIENAQTNVLATVTQNTTTYTDATISNNQTYTYLVRSVKLISTGAGSFHNLSRAAATKVRIAP